MCHCKTKTRFDFHTFIVLSIPSRGLSRLLWLRSSIMTSCLSLFSGFPALCTISPGHRLGHVWCVTLRYTNSSIRCSQHDRSCDVGTCDHRSVNEICVGIFHHAHDTMTKIQNGTWSSVRSKPNIFCHMAVLVASSLEFCGEIVAPLG